MAGMAASRARSTGRPRRRATHSPVRMPTVSPPYRASPPCQMANTANGLSRKSPVWVITYPSRPPRKPATTPQMAGRSSSPGSPPACTQRRLASQNAASTPTAMHSPYRWKNNGPSWKPLVGGGGMKASMLGLQGAGHGLVHGRQDLGVEAAAGGGAVVVQLLGPGRAHDRRGHRLVAQHPGQGQLGHGEAGLVGHHPPPLDRVQDLVGEEAADEGAHLAGGGPAVGRRRLPPAVLAGQDPLGQRRPDDL